MSLRSNHVQQGFSLIEPLSATADKDIIARIAIPYLLTSRRSANERPAISDLGLSDSTSGSYASSIRLGEIARDANAVKAEAFHHLGAAEIMDGLLAGGAKSGCLSTGGKIDPLANTPARSCGRAVPANGTGLYATGPRNVAIATDGVLFAAPAPLVSTAGCPPSVGGFVVASASPLST
jgi:hypothetical protein